MGPDHSLMKNFELIADATGNRSTAATTRWQRLHSAAGTGAMVAQTSTTAASCIMQHPQMLQGTIWIPCQAGTIGSEVSRTPGPLQCLCVHQVQVHQSFQDEVMIAVSSTKTARCFYHTGELAGMLASGACRMAGWFQVNQFQHPP